MTYLDAVTAGERKMAARAGVACVLAMALGAAGCGSATDPNQVSGPGTDGGVEDVGPGGPTDGGQTRDDVARTDSGNTHTDSGATGVDNGMIVPMTDSGVVPIDTGIPPGPCVPTVPHGMENTDALCSNGIDDDCNGYIDCNDYHCSRNAAVSVCSGGTDGGTPTDTGIVHMDVPMGTGPVNANGGTMSLLHFGVAGDCRPPSDNDTSGYPTAIIQQVYQGLQGTGAPFVIATGDYMFAINASAVSAQLSLYESAEAMYSGYVFHCMGNHECDGQTASNCPNLNEYPNIVQFRAQLQADLPNVYHDFTVHTSLGDAHFIMLAPNAWTPAQSSWFTSVLSAGSPTYTFVAMHEPPDAFGPPAGATEAESIMAGHAITLRLYGHTHEYSHQSPNILVQGNGGAPLRSPSGTYGFADVQQRSDGNIVVTEYNIGSPPMVASSFVMTPGGTVTH